MYQFQWGKAGIQTMFRILLIANFMVKIPRVINCLGAFRQGLPADVAQMLSTESSR